MSGRRRSNGTQATTPSTPRELTTRAAQRKPVPAKAPAAVIPDDGRTSLELSSAENADLCAGCVTCCTYVTIEVDAPRQAWEYDQWIWMLHHEGIEMYVERPEKWFVYIATRCQQLNAEGRCAIHGRHPVLCRDYDPRSCERRYPLSDMRAWFKTAEELEAWMRDQRPAHWSRLIAYRAKTPDAPPKARGRANGTPLVQIAGMTATGGSGNGVRR